MYTQFKTCLPRESNVDNGYLSGISAEFNLVPLTLVCIYTCVKCISIYTYICTYNFLTNEFKKQQTGYKVLVGLVRRSIFLNFQIVK